MEINAFGKTLKLTKTVVTVIASALTSVTALISIGTWLASNIVWASDFEAFARENQKDLIELRIEMIEDRLFRLSTLPETDLVKDQKTRLSRRLKYLQNRLLELDRKPHD